ncbi:hypothetical protein OSB04_015399 [Centaurea solstitialis]|uniref:tetraacyldisaccharide 4'-kinase n=1 Tax=Centaurea solstitialis TaxID=347529 RepID=A0AA38SYY6_9ASTR|nr:hypothetical protein OSB04_015399 [Centaurea solstitialis]
MKKSPAATCFEATCSPSVTKSPETAFFGRKRGSRLRRLAWRRLASSSMEKLRRMVNQIAHTQKLSSLHPLHLSLIPLLFLSSSIYKLAISFRQNLYHFGFLRKHRLPVPVISVGNLTWGGNGKTPMVEFIANWLANDVGISPLILTRGYGGADEAKMLQRHFNGTSVKIGVGANRAATAASFLHRYGFVYPLEIPVTKSPVGSDKIGVAIFDDGMQHISMFRDLEIVMVNALSPWGNHQLLPFGPLREPLTSFSRADAVVIHHADMVQDDSLSVIKLRILEMNRFLPIYLSAATPSHFFKSPNVSIRLPLDAVFEKIVLCVSAIGSPSSFVQRIKKMGALYVDSLDYSDHHQFQLKDIKMIKARLQNLKNKFGSEPTIVVTEKVYLSASSYQCSIISIKIMVLKVLIVSGLLQDYDRDNEILRGLDPFEVFVLCCKLKILRHDGLSEDTFKMMLARSLS